MNLFLHNKMVRAGRMMLFIAIMISAVSCQKDFLDKKPNNKKEMTIQEDACLERYFKL